MINLVTNYITGIVQDPLLDLATLSYIAILGMSPFVWLFLITLYVVFKIKNRILIYCISSLMIPYVVEYTYKVYLILESGYTQNSLLTFFINLSGSVTAICIMIVTARKSLEKTVTFKKNGVTKECRMSEVIKKNTDNDKEKVK